MVAEFRIARLTKDFYHDYPESQYPQILRKPSRAYTCVLIDIHDGRYICVPYRSNIFHKYAFKFKGTKRSAIKNSGLDYTKMVVVKPGDPYISNQCAIVDSDEYKKTLQYKDRIVRQAVQYLNGYCNHIDGQNVLDTQEFRRKYGMSSLQYFHKQLGIQGIND